MIDDKSHPRRKASCTPPTLVLCADTSLRPVRRRIIREIVAGSNGVFDPPACDLVSIGWSDFRPASDYAVAAKNGKLAIEDMTGGTFTITNGGVFGSLLSTPILNPPQTAILGMHKIQERPMAVKGQVVILPMMYLALSYDHRMIDGKDAVQFLVAIKDMLEDPARMLLDV